MIKIENVLTPEELRFCRRVLEEADWTDGRATAGHLAAKAKRNLQLIESHPAGAQLGDLVLGALGRRPLFMSAALPLKILPPRFNRYEGGGHYGGHVDSAVFSVPGSAHRVRGDISATLFLSAPEEYDGGELLIDDTYGTHSVKLPAGHLVIYPGSSVHRVTPVTRGTRLASFFWVQSLVREDGRRALLFDLDTAIQRLSQETPDSAAIVQLTGVYHNLLRQWSET